MKMEPTKAERMKAAQQRAEDAQTVLQRAILHHRRRKSLRRDAAQAQSLAPGRAAVRDALNADAQTHAEARTTALAGAETLIREAGFEPVRAIGSSGETVFRARVGNVQVPELYSGSDPVLRAAAIAVAEARASVADAMRVWRASR